MADSELNEIEQSKRSVTESTILESMVEHAGVMLLSSCAVQDFAQASIEVGGKRYLVKVMEI